MQLTYKSILGLVLARVYTIGANLYGTIQHPYLTWKKMIKQGYWFSSLILLIVFSGYFGVREPIKWGNIRWNGIYIEQLSPYKVKFWAEVTGGRVLASIFSYFFITLLLVTVSRLFLDFKFKQVYKKVFVVWIYSYLPTVIWFTLAAVLFVILPPPRQLSYPGLFFSIVFLTCSAGLLSWKIMLYWLTMKLAIGLNSKQIVWSSMIIIAVILCFSQIMYWLDIFKLPFI